MGIATAVDRLIFDAEPSHAPVTYHVQLAPELARLLETAAIGEGHKPETIIAEAVRSYLGADQ